MLFVSHDLWLLQLLGGGCLLVMSVLDDDWVFLLMVIHVLVCN